MIPPPTALTAADGAAPTHRRDDGRSADPDLADHLEAEAQVERDVPGIRRLEVGQHPLAVAARDGVPHQLGSESPPLSRRLDADHR